MSEQGTVADITKFISLEGIEYYKGISKNASWIVIDGESGNSLACR